MKFSIRTLIWTSVMIALLIAGALALIPKPVNVEVALVQNTDLRVSVQEDGKTRIREKYIVSAPVSGRLSRIELRAGDEVCCDETLLAVLLPSDPVMLDSRAKAEAEARVMAAQAALQRAKSNEQQAEINQELSQAKFERAKRLLPNQAISRDDYDQAKADFLAGEQAIKTATFDSEIAKFELAMAKAAANQFENGQSSLEPFEIHSPVGGRVLRVFQESSTVVAVGAPLIEIGDPRNLEMEIDVLSTDAVRIKPGAALTVNHWGGEDQLLGRVRVIEPAAFTKISSLGVEEQRVNIIADFDEPLERITRLGDGYRIEARITIAQLNNVLAIPNSALFRHQRKWHVFQIVNDQAVMVPVTIGIQNETETEVTGGLSRGDEVVIYPSDQLDDGVKVRRVK